MLIGSRLRLVFNNILTAMASVMAVSALIVSLSAQAESQSPLRPSLLQDVDTRIGTSGGGNTFPGATAPFGMIQWSPDTAGNGFYYGHHKVIQGFSLTHLSGGGCPLFADMPILPLPVAPSGDRDDKKREKPGFSHDTEVAHPGYYAVSLGDGTRVELTASYRSGMARITYPAGQKAGLLINGAGSASTDIGIVHFKPKARELDGQSLKVAEDNLVMGTVTAGGFCNSPTRYTLYVAYQTQSKPAQVLFWQDGKRLTEASSAKGNRAVAWLDLGEGREQIIRVGLSYVSQEKALENLKAEQKSWDFDAARAQSEGLWTQALGKVEIDGASPKDRRIFYTGLYHMLVQPTLFSDADGEYLGFDNKIHKLKTGQKGQYTNISDWDTYRNVVQLQALLYPQVASDIAQSLVNDAEQMGSFPRWPVANQGTYIMGGDSPPLVITSIHAFGAQAFDTQTALKYIAKTASTPGLGQLGKVQRNSLSDYIKLGYIGVDKNQAAASETLEFANADYASAQFAFAVGDKKTGKALLERAGNWRNLLDPETKWIRPRNSDGSWLIGFDAEKSLPKRVITALATDQMGFEEGNTYQYSFMLPFDYQGLFNLMGEPLVEERLDRFFKKLNCWDEPCFNIANEPDFVTPYAYTFLGKPWKTAEVITRIENESFNDTFNGLPGNDDLGATSGVYVWNALGMYPVIAGQDGVVLGTPRFDRAKLYLGHGGTLSLSKQGDGQYVKSVSVNGKAYTSSWVEISRRTKSHTTIEFTMQPETGSAWGTAKKDRPPSMTKAAKK